MENKRGQGLSINTIILIALGVIVLVILAVGFFLGWGKILPWLSGKNVDDTITTCNAACSTQSKYDFCIATRIVKGDTEVKDKTCKDLALDATTKAWGFKECPGLCDVAVTIYNTQAEAQVGCKGKIAGTVLKYKDPVDATKTADYTCLATDI